MFMLTKTHKAAMAELKAQAARNIEPLVREIEEWKTLANDLGAVVEVTKDDAQKWRDSLKRSRERKAAKKTAAARDKRAKNRGGGK